MKELFSFLAVLEENNNREWFTANKPRYSEVESQFKDLVEEVQHGLSSIDNIALNATKIFRIYRDVRFSENKTPYHLHRSASFKRATEQLRGGYYLRIQRGASAIVGGFFGPESADMLHIRKQIQQEPEALRAIIASDDIQNYFGGLSGEQVKSAPRGFSKEDPAIDLLKYKQLLLRKDFSDKEVQSADFSSQIIDGFGRMRPFLDYMSEILTTDLNGEPLHYPFTNV